MQACHNTTPCFGHAALHALQLSSAWRACVTMMTWSSPPRDCSCFMAKKRVQTWRIKQFVMPSGSFQMVSPLCFTAASHICPFTQLLGTWQLSTSSMQTARWATTTCLLLLCDIHAYKYSEQSLCCFILQTSDCPETYNLQLEHHRAACLKAVINLHRLVRALLSRAPDRQMRAIPGVEDWQSAFGVNSCIIRHKHVVHKYLYVWDSFVRSFGHSFADLQVQKASIKLIWVDMDR